MLSSPDDFEGAQLQHEVRGRAEPVVASMARGDVTVYRSHQAHRVTPLTAGRRLVMAIELWHDMPGSSLLFELDSGTGEPTAARNRPHRRYGQCPA
jgi:predicted 2-oxoglutarate/Fe(II)-dependent dioxygenase YbiX